MASKKPRPSYKQAAPLSTIQRAMVDRLHTAGGGAARHTVSKARRTFETALKACDNFDDVNAALAAGFIPEVQHMETVLKQTWLSARVINRVMKAYVTAHRAAPALVPISFTAAKPALENWRGARLGTSTAEARGVLMEMTMFTEEQALSSVKHLHEVPSAQVTLVFERMFARIALHRGSSMWKWYRQCADTSELVTHGFFTAMECLTTCSDTPVGVPDAINVRLMQHAVDYGRLGIVRSNIVVDRPGHHAAPRQWLQAYATAYSPHIWKRRRHAVASFAQYQEWIREVANR